MRDITIETSPECSLPAVAPSIRIRLDGDRFVTRRCGGRRVKIG
jgi:hypothetical protein